MQQDSILKQWLYKLMRLMPDRWFIMLKYYKNFGRFPNLKNPKTFNEKLQWLKLHDHNPMYTTMVDKCEAKKYVAGIIGGEYIIPTLGVWDRAEDIDFDTLPDQFVLKATHDSGRVIICKDKSKLDFENARQEMRKSLKRDFYAVTREWPYKNVKPRIIAEKYMEETTGTDLTDYKVHCFNGTPRMILLCKDRFGKGGLTEDFYSDKWEHINLKRPGTDNAATDEPKPAALEEMLRVAGRLAADHPFVRTDFYTIDNKLYFGELTLYPASGMTAFCPKDYDDIMGQWLEIPCGGGYLLVNERFALTISAPSATKGHKDLLDYKFFCFDGKAEFLKVDFNRFTNHRANYYDLDFNLLPWGETIYPPESGLVAGKPENLIEMITLAERLSAGVPFLRVDMYDINSHLYFGELTFFPNSGMVAFTDPACDTILGDMLKIEL